MKKETRVLVRLASCAALAIAGGIFSPPSSRAQGGVPKYEVDLSWPKPLPDRWVLGGLGVRVCIAFVAITIDMSMSANFFYPYADIAFDIPVALMAAP